MLCEVQGSISYFFWLQGPPDVLYLKEYYQTRLQSEVLSLDRYWFWISSVRRYFKFKTPYLPSFDFRVLQMSWIWKNIIKLSLSSWWMWLEMGNRMIYKDFEFQTWHAIGSSRLHIFLLSTSESSRCLVFERILSNYHNHHDECD